MQASNANPLVPPHMPEVTPAQGHVQYSICMYVHNTNPPSRHPPNNPPQASNANPLVPPHLPEVCPQCQARFASVERLIQHVEDFHPAATSSSSSAAAGTAAGGYQGQQGQQAQQRQQRGGGAAQAVAAAAGAGVWPGEAARGARGGSGAAAAAGAGGGSSEQFVCPRCSAVFFNPVRLVQHTEGCTGAAQSQAAGSGDKGCTVS